MQQIRRKAKGFTLLELIITITILAILSAIAMPSYRSLMEQQKLRSALNEWQTDFYFAQREAMRLKDTVTLCGSSDGVTCNQGNVFNQGWIVFHVLAIDAGGNPVIRILRDNAFNDNTITMGFPDTNSHFKNGVSFHSNGRLGSAAGTLTVEMARSSNKLTRTLTISTGGRLTGGS